MSNDIMVSVSCIAYNHGKYIRQCLEGLVNQITTFKYEILVHDDASTDDTADIIREYEEKYPDIIKPIYQTENQYSKRIGIIKTYQYSRVKGKYVAYCEGDDFWIDPYKLQKQFDIMEKNPNCSICVHRVKDVLENGEDSGKYHPNFHMEEGIINLKEYLDIASNYSTYPFQTTSYFMRMDEKKELAFNPPAFVGKFGVGDVPTMLFALTKGDMYYIDEIMTCYRLQAKGSWSSNIVNDEKKKLAYLQNLVYGYGVFDHFTNHEYHNEIEKICEEKKFRIALLSKDYKGLLKKEFKKYLTKKERLYFIGMAYFPVLTKKVFKG
ncbi:MAG: glycosyltransferase family 2 protein [Candidatus Gastranaerophilaceae bacterium]